jgi:hypothetical protein
MEKQFARRAWNALAKPAESHCNLAADRLVSCAKMNMFRGLRGSQREAFGARRIWPIAAFACEAVRSAVLPLRLE